MGPARAHGLHFIPGTWFTLLLVKKDFWSVLPGIHPRQRSQDHTPNDSVHSENCRKEVNFAIEEGIPIVAIHLEAVEQPSGLRPTLSNRQAILTDPSCEVLPF